MEYVRDGGTAANLHVSTRVFPPNSPVRYATCCGSDWLVSTVLFVAGECTNITGKPWINQHRRSFLILRHRCLTHFHLQDMAELFRTEKLLDLMRSFQQDSAALQAKMQDGCVIEAEDTAAEI